METKFDLQTELSTYRWRIKVPTGIDESVSNWFVFSNCRCRFNLISVQGGNRYKLYVHCFSKPSSPFYVRVYLSIGSDCIPYPKKTITDQFNTLVWTCDKTEILKRVPDFELHRLLCFRILLQDDASTEVESDDTRLRSLAPQRHLEALSQDFTKLLDGGSNYDVEVVCEGRTFKAHKDVLSSRSKVFAAMLSSDMVEGKTGLVQIEDVKAPVFQHFLRYLYTGKLPDMTVETAMRFYETGDKYSVDEFKSECVEFLTSNLQQDNACVTLVLADRHGDLELKNSAIQYILDKNVPLDDDWTSFCDDHPKLANEVLNRFFKLNRSK